LAAEVSDVPIHCCFQSERQPEENTILAVVLRLLHPYHAHFYRQRSHDTFINWSSDQAASLVAWLHVYQLSVAEVESCGLQEAARGVFLDQHSGNNGPESVRVASEAFRFYRMMTMQARSCFQHFKQSHAFDPSPVGHRVLAWNRHTTAAFV
jgi:hypothetical protein